jgi:hypothetical protein
MYDKRFYYPQPEDIRSDLKYNTDVNKQPPMFEIIDGVIKFKHTIETNKLIVDEITPKDGKITINGLLRVDAIETRSHIQITTLEFKDNKIINGDLNIKGDFNIEGNVNWSGKTNYVDTEIIRAEDNMIYLNNKGNHQTSKGGGIRLVKGINEENDCTIDIDESGYWNVYPGLNVSVLNVETINFEDEENGMLIGYLNGNKIGIPYKKINN